MKDFRSLKVWQKSHQFVLSVYKATAAFPKEDLYGLTSQLRRSSTSVPSNLAEGCGRGSDADLARFCQIAMGSASEAEYQLLLARDLGYLNEQPYGRLEAGITEVKRMLAALIARLQPTPKRPRKADR